MDGLDQLGADDLLASQYITLRVKSIDREKLKSALGGRTGEIAKTALSFVDMSPKAAVDVVLPIAKGEAKKYGVELETTVTNAPPKKGGRALSEFWPGLGIGLLLGLSFLGIGKGVAAVVHKLHRAHGS
jgi:hypothetical protein